MSKTQTKYWRPRMEIDDPPVKRKGQFIAVVCKSDKEAECVEFHIHGTFAKIRGYTEGVRAEHTL